MAFTYTANLKYFKKQICRLKTIKQKQVVYNKNFNDNSMQSNF